jgi:DNA-binding NarL/FixJ family response regulator
VRRRPPLLRKGVARLIDYEARYDGGGEASNGEERWSSSRHAPDVTLMDLSSCRDMNGVEAIHGDPPEHGDARIIVLTMYHGDEDIHRAVQAGAAPTC